MKIILLLRHSEPQRGTGLPNAQIPLSSNGEYRAKQLFRAEEFASVRYVCSSPYRRAWNTAKCLGLPVTQDERLKERVLGEEAALDDAFWEKQYLDHDYKTSGGESLNETRARMTAFMQELLGKMRNDEKAVVVSHAAAICAYLMNFCDIEVVDAQKKIRKIMFGESVVLNGKFEMPGGFILHFDGFSLRKITHISFEGGQP